MAIRVTEMRYLDALGRLRVTGAVLGGTVLVLAALVGGVALSRYVDGLMTWPYTVVDRRMVDIDGKMAPVNGVAKIPHGGSVSMLRWIDYHEVECERWYDRRAVSKVKDPDNGSVFVQRFDKIHDEVMPADLSGRWQEWSAKLDPKMPCGPGYLAEDVSAACNWWNYAFYKLHKPTIITPFEVVGCT